MAHSEIFNICRTQHHGNSGVPRRPIFPSFCETERFTELLLAGLYTSMTHLKRIRLKLIHCIHERVHTCVRTATRSKSWQVVDTSKCWQVTLPFVRPAYLPSQDTRLRIVGDMFDTSRFPYFSNLL